MSGTGEGARTFAAIRWARDMVREHHLQPREAQVLKELILRVDGKTLTGYPSIATLARAGGYQVNQRGGSTPVSKALARLQELRLIRRTQSGNGRAALTEILYSPTPTRRAVRDSQLYSNEGHSPTHTGDQPYSSEGVQPYSSEGAISHDSHNSHPDSPSSPVPPAARSWTWARPIAASAKCRSRPVRWTRWTRSRRGSTHRSCSRLPRGG